MRLCRVNKTTHDGDGREAEPATSMIKTNPQSVFVSQFAHANVRSLREAGMLSLDITGLNKAKKKIAQTQVMLESVLFTPPAGL